MPSSPFTARTVRSISDVAARAWDACANPSGLTFEESGGERYNPFVSHAFLLALEQSKSVGGRTGWTPAHVLVEDRAGRLVAARAGLSEVAQHGRIRLRPRLGAGLRAGRRPLLSEAAGRRAVHAGDRPAAARRARRAGGRARGADRARCAACARRSSASSIHVTFADAPDAEALERGGFRAAAPASSSISSTRATPISRRSSPRSPRASARRSSASGATRSATTSRSTS